MNANEVIAPRAQHLFEGAVIHPNDHVNVCRSSIRGRVHSLDELLDRA
jgi:fumarate hydratase class II